MLTHQQNRLKPMSIVEIVDFETGMERYACRVIDGFWNGKTDAHSCNSLFRERIGYYVEADFLEIIEDDIETIETNIDNPFGGLEKFR